MDRVDTLSRIETPEGVDLTLHPAGLLPRMMAWGIDLVLQSVFVGVAVMVLSSVAGRLGWGVILLIVFAVEWGYGITFEQLLNGQTPGKRIVGLRVVMSDGRPVEPGPSVIRNVLRAADLLPFGYVAGIVSMVVSDESQRLGDLGASTVVVYTRGSTLDEFVPAGPSMRPTVALTTDDQRIVVAFAARSRQWSRERADEIARLLVRDDQPEPSGRVIAWARWIKGQRQ